MTREWTFISRDPKDDALVVFIPQTPCSFSDVAFVLFRSFDFSDLLFVPSGPGDLVIHAIGAPLTGREQFVLDRFRPIGVRIRVLAATMAEVLEMIGAEANNPFF